jgi:hypothetical protein
MHVEAARKRGSPIAAQTIDAARAARSARLNRAHATTRARIDAIQRAGVSTLAGIARELEARGVRTPGGNANWHRVQVARMLAAIRAAEARAERKIRDRELGR